MPQSKKLQNKIEKKLDKLQEKDQFGEPLILEEGLCSLVDEWHSDDEETEDF